MSNDKATPRPWETYRQGECATGIRAGRVRVAEAEISNHSYEVAEANADLICEAVNSHDALKA